MIKYIITDGYYCIKKKVLIIDKNTDISNFTLEQMNILSALSIGENGTKLKQYLQKHRVKLKYWGLVEDKKQAHRFIVFRNLDGLNSHLSRVREMYGQNFVAEES